MRRLFSSFTLILLGVGLTLGALRYHLVRADQGFLWFEKRSQHWTDTYADVRGWTHDTWRRHEELSHVVRAQGKGDLIPQPGSEFLKSLVAPLTSGDRTERSDATSRRFDVRPQTSFPSRPLRSPDVPSRRESP